MVAERNVITLGPARLFGDIRGTVPLDEMFDALFQLSASGVAVMQKIY